MTIADRLGTMDAFYSVELARSCASAFRSLLAGVPLLLSIIEVISRRVTFFPIEANSVPSDPGEEEELTAAMLSANEATDLPTFGSLAIASVPPFQREITHGNDKSSDHDPGRCREFLLS